MTRQEGEGAVLIVCVGRHEASAAPFRGLSALLPAVTIRQGSAECHGTIEEVADQGLGKEARCTHALGCR